MSKRQTKEQERAKYAWERIEDVQQFAKELAQKEEVKQRKAGKPIEEAQKKGADKARSFENDYGSQARGLPALIQVNGLGQTLAYLLSKGKNDSEKPHQKLYAHLAKWVKGEMKWNDDTELMQKLTHCSSTHYRRATTEAMALLVWLRRFTEARLIKEDVQEGSNGAAT